MFERALCDLDHDGGFTGVVDSGAIAKVLIVEDNEMNRDMLSRRLERRGYMVVMVVDGAEGVAMSKVELPDIVLMDMSLPILNGWEATRAIKADALTAHPVHRAHRPLDAGRPREGDGSRLRQLRHQARRPAPPALEDGGAGRRGVGLEILSMTADEARELRHELRTPVNHLIGYAELLLEEDDVSPANVSMLEPIRGFARQALDLVPGLLADGAPSTQANEESVRALMNLATQLQTSIRALTTDEGLPSDDLDRLTAAAERLGNLAGRLTRAPVFVDRSAGCSDAACASSAME